MPSIFLIEIFVLTQQLKSFFCEGKVIKMGTNSSLKEEVLTCLFDVDVEDGNWNDTNIAA